MHCGLESSGKGRTFFCPVSSASSKAVRISAFHTAQQCSFPVPRGNLGTWSFVCTLCTPHALCLELQLLSPSFPLWGAFQRLISYRVLLGTGRKRRPPPSLVTVAKVQTEKLRLGEVQVSPRPHIAEVLPQTTRVRPSCALEHAGKSPEGLVNVQILAAGLGWGQTVSSPASFQNSVVPSPHSELQGSRVAVLNLCVVIPSANLYLQKYLQYNS